MSPGYLDILRKRKTVESTECGEGEVENKEVFKYPDPSVPYVAYIPLRQNKKTIEVPSLKSTIIPLSPTQVPNPLPAKGDISDIRDQRGEVLEYTIGSLERMCPDYVTLPRWKQAVGDGHKFLSEWSRQAESLGWTGRDLFELHTPPAYPHPSYNRMSRYDRLGLIWLLDGNSVIALTETSATIKHKSGSITTFRRAGKC
jgi:hypothetical protein